jgi:hypothetical protein
LTASLFCTPAVAVPMPDVIASKFKDLIAQVHSNDRASD